VFDPLASLGGSLLQERAIRWSGLEVVPPQANVVARRITTPLFGLGLIEAIPDATIMANVKVTSVDGVKGRAAVITDVTTNTQRVGRFGWKAQQATLLAFAGDAYLNEMGVTNRFFPTENAPNGNQALLAALDTVNDPEDKVDPATGRSDIDRAADYMRLLAPPPAAPQSPTAKVGAALFQQTGCAVCHVPTMTTGTSNIAALSLKPVNLYSDLLLHDMGLLADGIAQAGAGTREMKTAPLWGLRSRKHYLHDGRAMTLDDAIRDHDGEGAVAKTRFTQLNPTQKQQLFDFLNSL
jgi:CxxC motif-containing protein (DUF1111 family)